MKLPAIALIMSIATKPLPMSSRATLIATEGSRGALGLPPLRHFAYPFGRFGVVAKSAS